MKKRIAIVGATGLVGRKAAEVLAERKFPTESIKFLCSRKSAGTELDFEGNKVIAEELTEKSFDDIDIAIFSAGSEVSGQYAPIAAEKGCVVIDNSSRWRRDPDIPLVVPEVNPEALSADKKIIANPNCSTIQLVLPLKALADRFGLKRVVCSTYQSITGAGKKGVDKLNNELQHGVDGDKHPIAFNAIFHTADAGSDFTNEEEKMLSETRKILDMPELKLAFTCVRLPILGGHCESVNLETEKKFNIDEVRETLEQYPGITLVDDIANEVYPTPVSANNTDDVYVGRIRNDYSAENGLYLWVVSDNIRKGAALNTVQIAEKLIEMKIV